MNISKNQYRSTGEEDARAHITRFLPISSNHMQNGQCAVYCKWEIPTLFLDCLYCDVIVCALCNEYRHWAGRLKVKSLKLRY